MKEKTGLLEFLFSCFPETGRNSVKALLRNRSVYVDGVSVTQFDHPLSPGNKVEIVKEQRTRVTELRGVRIVFEDESLLVVEKDPGILSISDGKETSVTAYSMLYDHVKETDPRGRVFVVHRLDRETSGLMLFAKSYDVQQKLQTEWKETVSERTYVAVVESAMEKAAGTLRSLIAENRMLRMYTTKDPEKGQEAVLHYRTLKRGKEYSLLELNLETGRKNQIRVQLAEIGRPVTGDTKYGAKSSPIHRLALHARVLAFRHPVSGKTFRFETPVPAAFLRLCGEART